MEHSEHNHNHDHKVYDISRPIIFGIVLNLSFVIIEIIYGVFSNSLALITDAGHNFSDVISLILAWVATLLIKKKATARFTYGFKKGSILIAMLNSLLLLTALGAIFWEAIQRLYSTHEINGTTVIIVASIGILINGITTLLFLKNKEKDLNIRSAFLHMLTDTLISASVVVSGILILLFDINWFDPVLSIVIVIIILIGTWNLLKETIKLTIDAVPESINLEKVKEYLSNLTGVMDVHDLHVWNLSTSQIAITAHLVVEQSKTDDDFLFNVNSNLHDKFGIEHSTIQIEAKSLKDFCNNC